MRIPTCKVDLKRFEYDQTKSDYTKGLVNIRSDLYKSDLAHKAIFDRIELRLTQLINTSEFLKAKVDDLYKRRLTMIYIAALVGLLWGILLSSLFLDLFKK